jgi:hypothetical protein
MRMCADATANGVDAVTGLTTLHLNNNELVNVHHVEDNIHNW